MVTLVNNKIDKFDVKSDVWLFYANHLNSILFNWEKSEEMADLIELL